MIRFSRCSTSWRGPTLGAVFLLVLSLLGAGTGCNTHHVKVEPTHHTVEFKPIYLTIDVNLRVQKELDRFFEDVEQPEKEKSKGKGGKS